MSDGQLLAGPAKNHYGITAMSINPNNDPAFLWLQDQYDTYIGAENQMI